MQLVRSGLVSRLTRGVRVVARICLHMGLDPRKLGICLANVPSFIKDIKSYRHTPPPIPTFALTWRDFLPLLDDKRKPAGDAGGHYFHQDLWAARKIFQRHPQQHIDIGSRVDGFITHLLVFMPVTCIDIRAMESGVDGLNFQKDDATTLAKIASNSVDSISSLHAAEHFGLGRYSDPVDPDGCFKFMRSLQRVLAPGGRLYFSVPVGRERVEFNAHRVFSIPTVLSAFPELHLVSFSLVDDRGSFYPDLSPQDSYSGEFGCGMFEFTKTYGNSGFVVDEGVGMRRFEDAGS